MSGETSASGSPVALGLDDPELALPGRGRVLGGDALDSRKRRSVVREASEELVDTLGRSLHLEQDAALVVEDVAAQLQLGGEPEHVGAEPDPLDRSRHPRPHPAAVRRGGGLRSPGSSFLRPGSASSTSSRSTW